MVLVLILMSLIFGIGLYLVISGSILPFILIDFPIGITIANIILGAILMLFSLGMTLIAVTEGVE